MFRHGRWANIDRALYVTVNPAVDDGIWRSDDAHAYFSISSAFLLSRLARTTHHCLPMLLRATIGHSAAQAKNRLVVLLGFP